VDKCPFCGALPNTPISWVCRTSVAFSNPDEDTFYVRGDQCHKAEIATLKARLAALEGLVKDFAHLVTYRPHYTKAKTEEIYFAKAEDILARPLVRELMEIKP
jgi:hypothetical protein